MVIWEKDALISGKRGFKRWNGIKGGRKVVRGALILMRVPLLLSPLVTSQWWTLEGCILTLLSGVYVRGLLLGGFSFSEWVYTQLVSPSLQPHSPFGSSSITNWMLWSVKHQPLLSWPNSKG